MKVAGHEVETVTHPHHGGWMAIAYLEGGKQVAGAPCDTKELAEKDLHDKLYDMLRPKFDPKKTYEQSEEYQQRVIARAETFTPFKRAMWDLDVALTDRAFEAASQYHHYPDTPDKWFAQGGEWYLSDGGYSRVVYSEETGRLFLTSNSRDQVKARWDEALPQRAKAEAIINDYMRQELGEAKTKFAAVVLLKDKDDPKALIIKRDDEPEAGKWACPGGHCDPGEDDEAAAHRELKEETRLSAESLVPLGKTADGTAMFCGWAKTEDAKGTATDDAEGLKWVSVDNLPELAFGNEKHIRQAVRKLKAKEEALQLAREVLNEVTPRELLSRHPGEAEPYVFFQPSGIESFKLPLQKVASTYGWDYTQAELSQEQLNWLDLHGESVFIALNDYGAINSDILDANDETAGTFSVVGNLDSATEVNSLERLTPPWRTEGKIGSPRQNRWNPMGLHRNHRGQLVDKYGRVMDVDWDEFERKRLKPGEELKSPKVLNPLHQAAKATGQVEAREPEKPGKPISPRELLRKYPREQPYLLKGEIEDTQRLVKVLDRFDNEEHIYDDGYGPLWVMRESLGITGIARARSWEDAYSIAEDEFFHEADETVEELQKEYGFRREHVKIVRDPKTGEERDVQQGDYPFAETGVEFVRWETRETPDPDGWIDNELFQEAYGFRPNGPNARDTHQHGIYQKDLNGEVLDELTPALAEELQLRIYVEDEE